MKKIIYLIILSLFANLAKAQELELPFKFNEVPLQELNLKYYKKDSTAVAVVLYEKAFAEMKRVSKWCMSENAL